MGIRGRSAPGGGAGGGGPAPNTVLWATADKTYDGQTNIIRIPRITADFVDQNGVTRYVPIAGDRVTYESSEAIILHVEQPTNQTYTVLHLVAPLGVNIPVGMTFRIDRESFAAVAADAVDGALTAHTGNTQPTITVQGVDGGSFTVTFRARNGQHVGARRNGTVVNLYSGTQYDGVYHNDDFTEFSINNAVDPTSMLQLYDHFQNLSSGLFSVSTLNNGSGNANQAVSGTQWTFSGGVTGTAGATSLILHNLHSDVLVGDVIVFTGQNPDRIRKVTGVATNAANAPNFRTELTWSGELDFAYANDAAIRVDRSIGFAQSVATFQDGIKGDKGDAGPSVGLLLFEWAANNSRAAGGFFSVGNGEDNPRAGIFATRNATVRDGYIALSYGAAGDQPIGSNNVTAVRLFRNDASVGANFIAEGRITFPTSNSQLFAGKLSWFTGNLANATDVSITDAQAVDSFPVFEGDLIVAEIDRYSTGLAAAPTLSLTVEADLEFTRTVVTDRTKTPVGFWWTGPAARTNRIDVSQGYVDTSTAQLAALQFQTGAPKETFGDKDYDWGNIFVPENVLVGMDAIQFPVAGSREGVGIRLPEGDYRMYLWVRYDGTLQAGDMDAELVLNKIETGTDGVIAVTDVDRGSVFTLDSIGELDTQEFSVNGSDILYFHHRIQTTGDDMDHVAYLRIEKL